MNEPVRGFRSLDPHLHRRGTQTVCDPDTAALLLNNMTARIVVVGPDQCFRYANREALDFYGLQEAQVIGQPVEAIVGRAVFSRYAPIAEAVWSGAAMRWEGWVHYPRQGRRYIQETIVPQCDACGTVSAVAVLDRDQTDMRLREQELADRLLQLETSEALKSAIVDHALAAFISTDAHGAIVEFNPAAEVMFGRSRASVIGRSVSETIVPQRFRAQHTEGMRRLATGGASRVLGKRQEMPALRADGSEFQVEMVLWRTDVGGVVHYTSSLFDVTERRLAQEQIERQREALRQSEKLGAMGSLLAGVAHELNNPLSIVMGRASLLFERSTSPEVVADAKRIRDAADRCGRIVRTFLNMARSRPAQTGSVSLNNLVRAALDLLQYAYRTHGISLSVELYEGLEAARADPDQVGQVILNLLVNAQQALSSTSGERKVTVRTGAATDSRGIPVVWLRVSDNGPGVPAPLHARIFESFFTTKPEGVGTGIGLAVSRSVARDHGGDLVLETPEHVGGASFCLTLPVAQHAGRIAAAPVDVPAAATSARIMVVDDEPELTTLIGDMLKGAGYEVVVANSGAGALAALETQSIDAVVSDLHMPDLDGAELWRHIAREHPALERRVLFVTGDTLSPSASKFLRESKRPGLDKPFSKDDLLRSVQALLRTPAC